MKWKCSYSYCTTKKAHANKLWLIHIIMLLRLGTISRCYDFSLFYMHGLSDYSFGVTFIALVGLTIAKRSCHSAKYWTSELVVSKFIHQNLPSTNTTIMSTERIEYPWGVVRWKGNSAFASTTKFGGRHGFNAEYHASWHQVRLSAHCGVKSINFTP